MEGFLNKLMKGFDRYEIPYAVTSNIENYAFVVKFTGAEGENCFLMLVALGTEIRLHQLIGTRKTKHLFHYKDISEDFFMIIKSHYKTVKEYLDLNNQMCSATAHLMDDQSTSIIQRGVRECDGRKSLPF